MSRRTLCSIELKDSEQKAESAIGEKIDCVQRWERRAVGVLEMPHDIGHTCL